MISVLIPAYNECSNPFFWKTIDVVKDLQKSGMDIELIIGVTRGHDDTCNRLKDHDHKVIHIQTIKRADRLNAALEASTGEDNDWVLLNHPRSLLQKEAFHSLLSLPERVKWGAFTHEFDTTHPLLSFTSWWSNHVRGDIKSIFYLDHCLFVRKGLLKKVGGVPSLEIFEDTVLSLNLLKHHFPQRLSWKSTTSAIRFKNNGIWKQAILNQVLKLQFFWGKSDSMMNEKYEKDINLNNP